MITTKASFGAALAAAIGFGLAACATTQRDIEALADGSCQSDCAKAHEDSLYDEDRCRERCEPPRE